MKISSVNCEFPTCVRELRKAFIFIEIWNFCEFNLILKNWRKFSRVRVKNHRVVRLKFPLKIHTIRISTFKVEWACSFYLIKYEMRMEKIYFVVRKIFEGEICHFHFNIESFVWWRNIKMGIFFLRWIESK